MKNFKVISALVVLSVISLAGCDSEDQPNAGGTGGTSRRQLLQAADPLAGAGSCHGATMDAVPGCLEYISHPNANADLPGVRVEFQGLCQTRIHGTHNAGPCDLSQVRSVCNFTEHNVTMQFFMNEDTDATRAFCSGTNVSYTAI